MYVTFRGSDEGGYSWLFCRPGHPGEQSDTYDTLAQAELAFEELHPKLPGKTTFHRSVVEFTQEPKS